MAAAATRTLGLAAALGGLFGILWAPFLGAAYLATPEGRGMPALVAWDEPFRDTLPDAFADPQEAYLAYGRLVPVLIVGFLAGLGAVHGLQGRREGRFARATFWSLLGLHVVLLVTLTYLFHVALLDAVFFVALPAMLLSMVGYVVYGIVVVRARVLPGDAGWWLVAGGVLFLPLGIVLGHNSLGFYALDLAWIRIGWGAWRHSPAAARARRTATASFPPRRSPRR